MIRLILLALAAMAGAAEPSLRPVGVIGNTGEQGAALLRQTADLGFRGHGNTVGCGLALDPQGCLWTRLDDGEVSRLSLDGRLLGRFPSPKSCNAYDTIAGAGDHILLLANGELCVLPFDAAPGTAFKPLGVKLRALAHTPCKGRLAAVTADGKLAWVKPADGALETFAGPADACLIESDGNATLLVGARRDPQHPGTMHKLVDGKEVSGKGWPRSWDLVIPGITMTPDTLIWEGEGWLIAGAGHVSHLDAELNPDPGTVLGMQGKYVIGIGADWRPEIGVARGMVKVRPGLYAVSGQWGQPFFATWPDRTRSMRLVSWFSARPDCQALGINAAGEVFIDRLSYPWTACPDAFPALGEGAGGTAGQIMRVGDRLMFRLDRWAHGGSGGWALPVYSGDRMENGDFLGQDKLRKEVWWERADAGGGHRVWPGVAIEQGESITLLLLADTGGARALRMHRNGRYQSTGGEVAFRLAQPGKTLTSLAVKDAKTLIAAIDGQVVELTQSGEDWQEKRRWCDWGKGPEDRFGASIFIACDAGNLLVSDSERHRVLWFAADGGVPKAQLGTSDKAGSDLSSIAGPGLIALCGTRAVVHDSGNQRLIKLTLAP